MFYTKGKVDIKNSDFLTKHVCCPGDVMFKMLLFHFGNILWVFLKGNSASLLSIININDLTGHVFTLLLSRKQYEPELEQLNALQRRLNGTVLRMWGVFEAAKRSKNTCRTSNVIRVGIN